MNQTSSHRNEANLTDAVERIRAEKFPHLDRTMVLDFLSLHAHELPEKLSAKVDELIASRAKEVD